MILIPVVESSQVGEARRRAVSVARDAGLGEAARERVALIVTEIATNLVRHAVEGEVLIGPADETGAPGCHIVGTDSGPGVDSVEKALEDGFTTASDEGGIGGGLGAIRRLSDAFDVHTDPAGTTVVATVWEAAGAPSAPLQAGGVIVPKPGGSEGGDAWAIRHGDGLSVVTLIDVLGHGPEAATVARAALAAFREAGSVGLEAIEEAVSAALAGDRGAAIYMAEIPHGGGPMRGLGIGNIRGEVMNGKERHGVVSVAGIAGRATRSRTVLEYDWGPGAMLLLSTDGLRERQRDAEPPGLMFRAPMTIAATLYRRRRRGTDDSGVVVVRAD